MATQKLSEQFYQSFDASGISNALAKLAGIAEAERRRHPDFIGEGTHFQSFSFQAPSQAIPLAINVAKSSFLKRGPRALDQWRRAVLSLRQLPNTDLVPPMEIVEYAGLTAAIMPRGKPIASRGAASKALYEKLNEMSRSLGRAGMVLDDYPQLVESNGAFFINDWSDLQLSR